MDVTVVIVNWNSGPHLARLLRSLQPTSEDFSEVLVVDNDSTDSSAREVSGYSWIRSISLERNRGFAAAANAGIRQANSPWILLLNPDLVICEKGVRSLIQEAGQRPRAAILCGRLKDSQGRHQQSFQIRRLPGLLRVWKDALFLDELSFLFRRVRRLTEPTRVDQPAAAFWMLRKEAWQSLGGFDEDFYPAWFEDVDFCRRLKSTDWEIWFVPTPVAQHSGGYSVDKLGYLPFLRIYYGNLLRYWRKHHPWTLPLVWLPVKTGLLIRHLIYFK